MDIHSFVAVFVIAKIGGFLDNSLLVQIINSLLVQIFNAAGYGFKKKKKLVFRYSLSLVCNDYLSLSYALQ